jgi:hypothetical protein
MSAGKSLRVEHLLEPVLCLVASGVFVSTAGVPFCSLR